MFNHFSVLNVMVRYIAGQYNTTWWFLSMTTKNRNQGKRNVYTILLYVQNCKFLPALQFVSACPAVQRLQ